jgi:hypothetical protein
MFQPSTHYILTTSFPTGFDPRPRDPAKHRRLPRRRISDWIR